MTSKAVLIYLGLLVVAFFVGAKWRPDKVKVESHVDERKVEERDRVTATDKTETRVEVYRKDGTIKAVRIKTEARRASHTVALRKSELKVDQVQETKFKRGLSVSALVGLPLVGLSGAPVYGVALSKPFLGPITLGVWGLSNLTLGMSIGLEF